LRNFNHLKVPEPKTPVILPDSRPIDLEIGCGVGWHAITYGRQYPERTLVAIEHTRSRYQSLARRYKNHGCPTNIVPVHADAVSWITHRVPKNSIAKILILYPNPYPKKQHRNLRWHAMPFMGHLLKTLRATGTIEIATNKKDYADEAADYLEKTWQMSLDQKEELRDPTLARTHFELKYLERGETCYNLVFSAKESFFQ